MRISNFTATATWTVTIAATTGNTAVWNNGAGGTHDYNDAGGSPVGCGDSGDADTVAGQLSLNASVATSTPHSGCTNTGISLGSGTAYNQGVTDSVALITSGASTPISCWWDITGVSASQKIPVNQAAGSYTINFTLTAIAI